MTDFGNTVTLDEIGLVKGGKDMWEFWLGLTKDQQIKLITSIFTIIPIVIGAIISIYQFSKTKQKDIDFKLHEQRKEKYEEFLKILEKIISNTGQIEDGEMPFGQEEWMDLQLGMTMYASETVFKKYLDFIRITQEQQSIAGVVALGELILLMRKEVGFSDSKLTSRDCLRTFITDIEDPKYDKVFNEKIS